MDIAEVYPALWSRGFANEGRTGDQHDEHFFWTQILRDDIHGRADDWRKAPILPNFIGTFL
jgi:hypothetical protein